MEISNLSLSYLEFIKELERNWVSGWAFREEKYELIIDELD